MIPSSQPSNVSPAILIALPATGPRTLIVLNVPLEGLKISLDYAFAPMGLSMTTKDHASAPCPLMRMANVETPIPSAATMKRLLIQATLHKLQRKRKIL